MFNIKTNKFLIDSIKLFLITGSIVALFYIGKIPYMLPLAVIGFFAAIGLIIPDIIKQPNIYKTAFLGYFKRTIPFILVLFFYFAAFVHEPSNSVNIKEMLYGLFTWILLAILLTQIKKNGQLEQFHKFFEKLYLSIFIFIPVGVLVYFISSGGFTFKQPFGIAVDYNFLSFTIVVAYAILIQQFIFKEISGTKRFLLLLYATFCIAYIFIVGSRRGIVILLLLQLALFVYLFIIRNEIALKRRILKYFSFLFLLFFLGFMLFTITGKATRVYIVNQLYGARTEAFKDKFAKRTHRYYEMFNDSLNIKQYATKLWQVDPYNSDEWLAKFIVNREYSKFQQAHENGAFDKAFKHIYTIRQFINSAEDLSELLPTSYSEVLNTDVINSNYFNLVPWLCPIPYTEKKLYHLKRLEGVLPIQKATSINKHSISFEADSDTAFEIELFVPLVSLTKNTLAINLVLPNHGCNIKLFNGAGEQLSLNRRESESNVYEFEADNIATGIGVLKISGQISKSEALVLKDVQMKRVPLQNSMEFVLDVKMAKHYLHLIKTSRTRHKFYHQTYEQGHEIQNSQKDSLLHLLKKADKLSHWFAPYVSSEKVLYKKSTEAQIFKNLEKNAYSRAYAVVPCINNVNYSYSFFVKSIKKPGIYIKRYPETSNHELVIENVNTTISKVDSTLWHINYHFSVVEVSSGLGALVIGVKDSNEGDRYQIIQKETNVSFEPEDIRITKNQYNKLKVFIQKSYAPELVQNWWSENKNKRTDFSDSRFNRWRFAVYYFSNFNFTQKLLGNGFEYMSIYATTFRASANQKYDYPHNPIISAFLYSGILGGITYILFLIIVVSSYWKKRKALGLYFVLFLISLFFVFFSGNSHFSVPAFVFLTIFPFSIDIKSS